ncbi:MAG: hypothetical protein K9L66_05015 [Spirochaetaceae bacterium]|nr:hypothetical protein [Spirochaetaceae bacterium]MCF7948535.1 hypothetical protein [Spirochaetia bacterium]MCF7951013.1 hypothetical protein [Spirochaetaceae bacterium]
MISLKVFPGLAQAVEWAQEQIEKNPYSDVGFTATIHNGQIKRLTYTVTVKQLPEQGASHDSAKK